MASTTPGWTRLLAFELRTPPPGPALAPGAASRQLDRANHPTTGEHPMLDAVDTSFELAGRKALVTGASRGIGEAIALGLARFGADVAVTARDVARLAEVSAAIDAMGRQALPIAMDARDVAGIRAAIDEAAAGLGGLDLLVVNAGMEEVCPSLEVEEALWDRIIETNLKGAFFTAQAAARLMAEAESGGTVLTVCSLTSAVGVPTAAPYGASKSGLLGLTRALATEWAPLGIRVNAIGPGYFRTALTEMFYADADWQAAMLEKIPAGRFGDLRDLVGAAVFLSSDAARYVSGQILYVDGGYLAAI